MVIGLVSTEPFFVQLFLFCIPFSSLGRFPLRDFLHSGNILKTFEFELEKQSFFSLWRSQVIFLRPRSRFLAKLGLRCRRRTNARPPFSVTQFSKKKTEFQIQLPSFCAITLCYLKPLLARRYNRLVFNPIISFGFCSDEKKVNSKAVSLDSKHSTSSGHHHQQPALISLRHNSLNTFSSLSFLPM